jgi:hypothetical protein
VEQDVAVDTNPPPPPPPCGDTNQACCNNLPACPPPGLTCDTTQKKCVPATATDIGKSCAAWTDCSAHACTPVTNIGAGAPGRCTERCDPTQQGLCPGSGPNNNWSCSPSTALGGITVCQCAGPLAPETCNGRDDDCNGVIDDEPGADNGCKQQMGPGETCVNGLCVCSGMTCGGSCVNTSSDPNNCGACGHSCHGGPCAGGQCQPLVVYDSTNARIGAIAVDTTHVYFTIDQGPGGASTLNSCGLGDGVCPGLGRS